jgi:hypothetical protein
VSWWADRHIESWRGGRHVGWLVSVLGRLGVAFRLRFSIRVRLDISLWYSLVQVWRVLVTCFVVFGRALKWKRKEVSKSTA